MNNETPTPRTDAEVGCYRVIGAAFARTLERGLNSIASMLGIEDSVIDNPQVTVAALVDTMRQIVANQIAERTRERDALRLAFAEASHNAGPAFVAHEDLAQCRAQLEAVTRDRDRWHAEIVAIMSVLEDCPGAPENCNPLQGIRILSEQRDAATSSLAEMTEQADATDERLRNTIAATELVENEGSTFGMVHSICDLAKHLCAERDVLKARLAELESKPQ